MDERKHPKADAEEAEDLSEEEKEQRRQRVLEKYRKMKEDQKLIKEEYISYNPLILAMIVLPMVWASLFPGVFLAYFYFLCIFLFNIPVHNVIFPIASLSDLYVDIMFVLVTAAVLVGLYLFSIVSTWLITYAMVRIIRWYSPPKEQIMDFTMENKPAKAFLYKGVAMQFLQWIIRPLLYFNIIKVWMLRSLGVKIGKNCKIYTKYVLPDDLIEIGDNCVLAKNTTISGHLIDYQKIIFIKTKIGNNCIFRDWQGYVGCEIGDNSFVKRHYSGAVKGFLYRGNATYEDVPMKKIGPYPSEEEIKSIKKEIKKDAKKDFYKEKLKDIPLGWLVPGLLKASSLILGFLALALFFVFYFGVVLVWFYMLVLLVIQTFGNFILGTMIQSLGVVFTPFALFGGYLYLLWLGCVPTYFLHRFTKKNALTEGEYPIYNPDGSVNKAVQRWKLKMVMKRFCIRIVHTSPFGKWDYLILKYVFPGPGKCDISPGAVYWKSYFDPEFLKIGNQTQCAVLSRVESHHVEDGKLIIGQTELGKNVIVGSLAIVRTGAKIGDISFLGAGVHIRPFKKVRKESLMIGHDKPVRYPLEFLKRQYKSGKKERD